MISKNILFIKSLDASKWFGVVGSVGMFILVILGEVFK